MSVDILATLGGRQVFGPGTDQLDLIEEVERGLPTKAYTVIAKALDLTAAEEDRLLHVSMRTRARWKQRTRLDPATSDRLVRLARILALAIEVLESRTNAVEWLREPSDALAGRTPLQVLTADVGAEKVTNMLYQMEHGIYA
jgi:putative toxin-antitoxin system antitoxin component (TIGR02293 family)